MSARESDVLAFLRNHLNRRPKDGGFRVAPRDASALNQGAVARLANESALAREAKLRQEEEDRRRRAEQDAALASLRSRGSGSPKPLQPWELLLGDSKGVSRRLTEQATNTDLSPYKIAEGSYRTALPEQEEAKFQEWYRDIARKTGIDYNPDDPQHKYDYRGAFRSSQRPEIGPDGQHHWPSSFKDEDHPNRFVDGVDTRGVPLREDPLSPLTSMAAKAAERERYREAGPVSRHLGALYGSARETASLGRNRDELDIDPKEIPGTEKVAGVGGMLLGALPHFATQSAAAGAASTALATKAPRAAEFLSRYAPGGLRGLSKGKQLATAATEGLPFDLAYKAEDNNERAINALMGTVLGSGIGALMPRQLAPANVRREADAASDIVGLERKRLREDDAFLETIAPNEDRPWPFGRDPHEDEDIGWAFEERGDPRFDAFEARDANADDIDDPEAWLRLRREENLRQIENAPESLLRPELPEGVEGPGSDPVRSSERQPGPSNGLRYIITGSNPESPRILRHDNGQAVRAIMLRNGTVLHDLDDPVSSHLDLLQRAGINDDDSYHARLHGTGFMGPDGKFVAVSDVSPSGYWTYPEDRLPHPSQNKPTPKTEQKVELPAREGEGVAGFYSRLENALAKAPFEKGVAGQWRAALSKNVAAGEREWTGIDKLLNDLGDRTITKNELRSHLTKNRLMLKETVLDNKPSPEEIVTKESADEASRALVQVRDQFRAVLRKYGYSEDEVMNYTSRGAPVELVRAAPQESMELFDAAAQLRVYLREDPDGLSDLGYDSTGLAVNALLRASNDLDNFDLPPKARHLAERAREANRKLRQAQSAPADPEVNEALKEFQVAHEEASRAEQIYTKARAKKPKPEFGIYTSPGGENYREILIELDRTPSQARDHLKATRVGDYTTGDYWEIVDGEGNFVTNVFDANLASYEAINEARRRLLESEPHRIGDGRDDFTGGHYRQPNVLAHIRVNDRTLPNGERVLYAEEVQSDWHQQGRDRGYAKKVTEEELSEARSRIGRAQNAYEMRLRELFPDRPNRYVDADDPRLDDPELMRLSKEAEDASFRLSELKNPVGVPDAPYKKTDEWVGLVFRRLIDEAVEGGYDRVAWTPGKVQTERYPGMGGFERKGLTTFYDNMVPQAIRDYAKKVGVKLDIEPAISSADRDEVLRKWREDPQVVALTKELNRVEEEWGAIAALSVRDQIRHFGGREKYNAAVAHAEKVQNEYTSLVPDELKAISPSALDDAPSFRVTDELKSAHREKGKYLYANSLGQVARTAVGTPGGRAAITTGVGAAAGGALAPEGQELEGSLAGAAVGMVGGAAGNRIARKLNALPSQLTPPAGGTVVPRQPRAPKSPIDNIYPEHYINPEKFGRLTPEEFEMLEVQAITVVQNEGLYPKEVKSHRSAKLLAARVAKEWGVGTGALDLKKIAALRLNGVELLAIRNAVNANLKESTKLTRRLESTRNPPTTVEAAEIRLKLSQLDDTNQRFLDLFIRGRTQKGRDLNYMKIAASQSRDPTYWLSTAQRMYGGPMPPELKDRFIKLLKTAKSTDEIAREVAALKESSIWTKIATGIKAGFLSTPLPDIANFTGNTAMAIFKNARDYPATFVDALVMHGITGSYTKSAPGTGSFIRQFQGLKQGGKEAAEMMGLMDAKDAYYSTQGPRTKAIWESMSRMAERIRRSELTAEELAKLDYSQTNFDTALIDFWVKGTFKRLGAEDRIFRGVALMRSLYEQAAVSAKNQGIKGDAAKAEIERILSGDIPIEMQLRAMADADVATFQNRGKLARILGTPAKVAGGSPFIVPVVGVLPFTTTPANIAEQLINASPVGIAKGTVGIGRLATHQLGKWATSKGFKSVGDLAMKAVRESDIPQIQKEAAEDIAEGIIGTAIYGFGAWLAHQKLMSGDYPTDQGEQGLWEATGKQANSIYWNGEWLNVNRFSPVGQMLVIGAQLYEIGVNPDMMTATDMVGAAGVAAARTVVQMSPLQGVDNMFNALDRQPGAGGRFVANLVTPIPTAVTRLARATDDRVRQPRGVKETIMSKTPGLRDNIPASRSVLGEEIEAKSGVVANFLDPTSSRTDRGEKDPLIRELDRVGASLVKLRREKGWTSQQYRDLQGLYGVVAREELTKVTSSEGYKNMPTMLQQRYGLTPEQASEIARLEQKARVDKAFSDAKGRVTKTLNQMAGR